jgi:hypothetical protein
MKRQLNEELYQLAEPHKYGESYVTVNGEVIATQMTLAGARFTQRVFAKRKIKAEVWQGWRVGAEA